MLFSRSVVSDSFVTLWNVAHQAPLSMGFPSQECWSGSPFSSPVSPLCCCCCSVASVVSDSVRPHRRQPTRLPHPWDSPGKNTGVGCHFLLQCMKVKSESEVAQSCPTLSDHTHCSPPGSSVHGIFQARVLEWVAIAFSSVTSIEPPNLKRGGRAHWSHQKLLKEELDLG